jgi:hypothetical protein
MLDRQSEKLGTKIWNQVDRIEKQDVEVVEKFGGPCPLDHTEQSDEFDKPPTSQHHAMS